MFAPGVTGPGYRKAGRSAELRQQFLRQNKSFGVLSVGKFLRDVSLFWMDRNREIRRQSPRGRGPNDEGCLAREWAGHDRKLDVNRGVLPLLVFDFGLGQGGLRTGAPEDRLHRFINQPALHEDGEGAQDFGFVGRVHREVGMFPIAEDAEALELRALDVDEFSRKRLRPLPHFERRKAAGFFHHLVFDRQAVAIPARDKRRAETGHRFRFHDEVLEDLIESGAHVDVAVGKGRAVVQDKELRRRAGGLDLLVEADLFPLPKYLRLTRGQPGLHRKIRFRKVEGLLVILAHRGAATLTFALGKATRRSAREIGLEELPPNEPGDLARSFFHFEPAEK